MKNYSLFCSVLFSLTHCQSECCDQRVVPQEYLHPNLSFDRVQAICNTIWSDLDLFLVEDSQVDLESHLPALEKNIGCLWCAVKKLIMHDESSNYLVDDIRYLNRMIEMVAYKYKLAQDKIQAALNKEINAQHAQMFAMICLFLQQLAAASYEVVAS